MRKLRYYFAVAVLGLTVFAACGKPQEQVQHTSAPEETVTPEPTATPVPTQAPTPTPM